MKKYIALACILGMLFIAVPLVRAGTITETGVTQRDLVRYLSNIATIVNELKADVNLLRAQVINSGTASPAGFGIGHTASAKTTGTYYYDIEGIPYVLIASSSMVYPMAAGASGNFTTQTTPSYCYYLYGIDATGNLTVTQGTQAAIGATITLPAVPTKTAPLGYILVYATTNNFTLGSDVFMKPYVGATPTAYQLRKAPSISSSGSTAISASDLSLVNP